MKVYLLYAHPSIIRPGTEIDDMGVKELYALTSSKELYKDFKHTRDMNKFEIRVMNLTKEEYRKMANDYRECVLQWCGFKSKKDNPYPKSMNDTFGDCIDEYKFAVTYLESMSVTEACSTFFEHCDLDLPAPFILSSNLYKILKLMGLDYIYKLTRFPFIGEDAMYCTSDEIARRSNNPTMKYVDTMFLRENMDFSMPDLWVDQLEVFIEIYGHLMKL